MNIRAFTHMMIRHEGLHLKPYKCPAGKLTIGFGRNLDDVGITKDEAAAMLSTDVGRVVADLRDMFSEFDEFEEDRQHALMDMRYNLGPGRFRTFEKMIEAVRIGAWSTAAEEALDSKWAKQVGSRAQVVSALLRSPHDG